MEAKHTSLVDSQYKIPFILVTSLFFLWGFAHAILDVLNKHFQEVLDISKAHSAFVQVTMYMGYFIMAIPAGLFISRYGYRKGVVFGLLLHAIGAVSRSAPGQYAAIVPNGFSLRQPFASTVADSPFLADRRQSLCHRRLGAEETAGQPIETWRSRFNGVGCICAPLLTGLLLFSNDSDSSSSGNVALPYVCMGVLVLIVAFIFTRVKLPEIPHHEEVDTEGHKVGLWSHRLFIFGLIAIFAYEIAEISINSFFINYVVEQKWMNARHASLILSFGGLGSLWWVVL